METRNRDEFSSSKLLYSYTTADWTKAKAGKIFICFAFTDKPMGYRGYFPNKEYAYVFY
jgi:hypothetical protein